MSHATAVLVAMGLAALMISSPAEAGLEDPAVLRGEPARQVFNITGVESGPALATLFHCTSTATAEPVLFGVEVFDDLGNRRNGIVVVSIRPGETGRISTGSTAAFDVNATVEVDLSMASARILADSENVICGAMLVDRDGDPPASMAPLPLVSARPDAPGPLPGGDVGGDGTRDTTPVAASDRPGKPIDARSSRADARIEAARRARGSIDTGRVRAPVSGMPRSLR